MSKTFCGVCGSSAESNGGTSGRGCYACFGAKKKEKAVSKRITTGMRIEAKRLGLRPEDIMLNEVREAKRIDRAITAAVRKERERCVGIVRKECNTDIAWVGRTTVCNSIIKAINGGKRGKA